LIVRLTSQPTFERIENDLWTMYVTSLSALCKTVDFIHPTPILSDFRQEEFYIPITAGSNPVAKEQPGA
jgi:hypothetical protein